MCMITSRSWLILHWQREQIMRQVTQKRRRDFGKRQILRQICLYGDRGKGKAYLYSASVNPRIASCTCWKVFDLYCQKVLHGGILGSGSVRPARDCGSHFICNTVLRLFQPVSHYYSENDFLLLFRLNINEKKVTNKMQLFAATV